MSEGLFSFVSLPSIYPSVVPSPLLLSHSLSPLNHPFLLACLSPVKPPLQSSIGYLYHNLPDLSFFFFFDVLFYFYIKCECVNYMQGASALVNILVILTTY